MTRFRALVCTLAMCGAIACVPARAAAQDLFELEVFRANTIPSGRYDLEVHTNVLSSDSAAPDSVAGNHRPAHLSVELARGWTDRLDTAVFVQTAPFASSGSARFAGGHLRSKIRIGELPTLPLKLAVSAEYAFNRPAFDRELQTLELRTIVDYTSGRLSLVANPSLEVVTQGADNGFQPVFDLSARAAWRLAERLAVTTDYFSAAATTRHLQPEPQAHHLIFGGVEVGVGSGWELTVSAGHCVTSPEPWVMRSVIGYGF